MKRYLIMLLMAVMFLPVVSSINTSQMIAYWTFDIDARDYMNTHNGTVTNAVHNASGCASGGCYYFKNGDGTYIRVPSSTDMHEFDSWSWSVWIQPGAAQDQYANAFSSHSGSGWNFEQSSTSLNSMYVYFEPTSGTLDTTASPFTLNQSWYHLVAVRNASVIRLYVNGTLAVQVTGLTTNKVTGGTLDFYFGRWAVTADRWYTGQIDEFGIWNRSLTQTEITALWNGGTPLQPPFSSNLAAPVISDLSVATKTTGTIFGTDEIGCKGLVSDADNTSINVSTTWFKNVTEQVAVAKAYPGSCYNRTAQIATNCGANNCTRCDHAYDGIASFATYNYYSPYSGSTNNNNNVTFYFNNSYTFVNWSVYRANSSSSVGFNASQVSVSSDNSTWTVCRTDSSDIASTEGWYNYTSNISTCTGSAFKFNMTLCDTYSCYIGEINFTIAINNYTITQNGSYNCSFPFINNSIVNQSFHTTTACGNWTAAKAANESFLCQVTATDGGYTTITNSSWLRITDSTSSPTLNSNLSAATLNLSNGTTMIVNLSNGNNWNETATCGVMKNVSWMTCNTSTMTLAVNSTVIGCSWGEGNYGNVQLYGQCNSSSWSMINTSSVVKSINSTRPTPTISTNLTTADWLFPNTTGRDWLITGTNYWNATATCTLVTNVSWISCSAGTLDIATNQTIITCQAQSLNAGYVSVYGQCNSTSSGWYNINSSAVTMFVNSTSESPSLISNLSVTALNLSNGLTMTVNLSNGDRWNESASCGIIHNASWMTCNTSTMTLAINSTVIGCSWNEGHYDNVKLYGQCNSSGWSMINTTSVVKSINSTRPPPTLNTNLTTADWVYPATEDGLGMTWNVSYGNWWNESTSSCAMISNVSWVSCGSLNIDINSNSTLAFCTASQKNSGIVSMYAQCNSSFWSNVNSPSVNMWVEADSHPALWTNISNFNSYLLQPHQFTSIGVNYTENPTSCALILNDTGLSCTSGIISTLGNGSKQILYNCTPQYIQEKYYRAYAQCNGTLYNLVNSSNYDFLVDANSNPSIGTNISSYNDYNLSGHRFYAIGVNYTESPLSCALKLNDTGLSCTAGTITLLPNTSYQINYTCTPSYVQQKWYQAYAQCNGTLYNGVNSSNYDFFVNANANPTVGANFSNITHGMNTYNLRVNGTNMSLTGESFTCGVLFNNTDNSCANVLLKSPTYENVSVCTEIPENGVISQYVNCNSTSYLNINSSTSITTHDSLYSTVNIINPPNTTMFVYENQATTLRMSCEHVGIITLNTAAITCVNQSGDTVVSNSSYANNQNIFHFNTTTTLDADEILCTYSCLDNFTGLNSSTRNMSIVRLNMSDSNLSGLGQVNAGFSISAPFNFNGNNATCNLVLNSSVVSCTADTGPTPALINCALSSATATNVSAQIQCNDTSRTYIKATTQDTELFSVDNEVPMLTVSNWTANKTFVFANITGQFRFQDNLSIYRWNVTIDGTSIDSAFMPAYLDYIYNLSVVSTDYTSGIHDLSVMVADGHTDEEIGDYQVQKGGLFDNKYLKITTTTGNVVTISAYDQQNADVWDYEKEVNKYKFSLKIANTVRTDTARLSKAEMMDIKEESLVSKDLGEIKEVDGKTPIEQPLEVEEDYIMMKLRVHFKEMPYIMSRPDSEYRLWVISGDNWIDFMSDKIDLDATQIYKDLTDKTGHTLTVNLYHKGLLDANEVIQFNSIGDLNIVYYNTTFYTLNVTATYESLVAENSPTPMTLYANTSGTPYTFSNISAILYYNESQNVTLTKTSGSGFVNFAGTAQTPNLTATNITYFYWNITVPGEPVYQMNLSHTVYFIGIGTNCSEPGYIESVQFCGRDEENITMNVTDMRLNINLDILYGGNVVKKFAFEFDNATCYSVCITPNTSNYTVNSKMEFGDGEYTDRKYYLTNYNMDNVSETTYLYHLNDSKASDIILTVYDKNTGVRITDAYVKILRYYPGKDNSSSTATYQTVEIEKTDINGQTLGKMVLADVWYKFIVEYPAGTVILNTDIEKMLTTDKLLPVSLSAGNLMDYNELININTELECNFKNTSKLCTYTWSNPTGESVTGILRIYYDTGYKKVLYHESTLISSAAEIAYVIPIDTSGRFWVAEGWIRFS